MSQDLCFAYSMQYAALIRAGATKIYQRLTASKVVKARVWSSLSFRKTAKTAVDIIVAPALLQCFLFGFVIFS